MPKPNTIICELCGGRGFTVHGDRPVDCQCIRERRKTAAYDAIGIPKHLQKLNIESFVIKQDATGDDNKFEIEKRVARSLVYQWCEQVGECVLTGQRFVLDPTRAYEAPGGKDNDKPEDADRKRNANIRQETWSGSWVILRGGRSSGKSLFAAVMAKAAAAAGTSPKVIQWAEVVESCYDFDRSSSGLYSRMSIMFERCSPLIIENVDTAYERTFSDGTSLTPNTKIRLDVLFGPINADSRPVVFTTSRETAAISAATNSLGPVLGSILEEAAVIDLPGRTNTFQMTVLNSRGGVKPTANG